MMRYLVLTLLVCASLFSFAQNSMPKRGYALDWIIPKVRSNPTIALFDKIELGVGLHDTIEQKISAFIEKEVTEKLNPFNLDDIDIEAHFSLFENDKWVEQHRIYAFYYEDFQRNTSSSDCNEWNWSKEKTNDRFRIRFTPDKVGKWHFDVRIKIKQKEVVRLGEYEFLCEQSAHKGYVKVSDGGRYLKLGKEVFMPVGQNLPKPSCYFKKDSLGNLEFDEYECSKCVCATVEEWCPHIKDLPMSPKAYMVYLKELEKHKDRGGNFLRMLIYPHTYELEYDHLGDYSSRMNVAWELDQFFLKTEQLNLKVNLNLFLGYPFTKAQYGVDVWDWYADGGNDKGYCYQSELGLKDPAEFLTNPTAKAYYKKKLRYIISRWGYSTSIALIEMISEANNKFPNNPKELYLWQLEMTKYIKEDLGHTTHLLAVNYDNACPDESNGDYSFSIPFVDVISHNIHRVTNSREKLQFFYRKFSKYNKPMLFSEIGTGDSEFEKCDNYSEWLKDLWMTIFSGTASSGINWNNQNAYDLWKHFEFVSNFVSGVNFDDFTKQSYLLSKDKLVEVLLLGSESNDHVIGVAHNLTWNYFTNSTSGVCQSKYIPDLMYRLFQTVSAKGIKNGLKLKLVKKQIYSITWINPFSGEKIQQDTVLSYKKGRVNLLHPELTKELPFVVFKLDLIAK